MRLLILTQKVDKNDPVLGFFHRWIEEFAKIYDGVVVICLYKGEYNLSEKVRVFSLGKEEGQSRITYIKNFYHLISEEKDNYDSVFVHMNPEYVILGGLFWRMWGKKVGLWYVHRAKNFRIWLAEKLANVILSSAKESFRIKSGKVHFLGHGIDTEKFPYETYDPNHKKLISIGRITPIKNYEVLIDALALLNHDDPGWRLRIIGGTGKLSDLKYKNNLLERVERLELSHDVHFEGGRPVTGEDFHGVFASVNMTPTGGMDKVVLESLSAGCPVFTSNEAYREILGDYADRFIFEYDNAYDLTEKIRSFAQSTYKTTDIEKLSLKIRSEYDVSNIVEKISNILNEKTS